MATEPLARTDDASSLSSNQPSIIDPLVRRAQSRQQSTSDGRPVRTAANDRSQSLKQTIAKGLGWFSIALGAAEVLAPHAVAQFIGVRHRRRDHHGLIQAFGLREIAAGIGILTQERPAGWLWARVAGDVLDLSALGAAMASDDSELDRLAFATVAVAGVTALDIYCAQQLSRDGQSSPGGQGSIHVQKTMTVNRSREELYEFWKNFENFPKFMKHLDSVRKLDGKRSHWVAKGPLGSRVEWDAETTADIPNQEIAWRTLPDSQVYHAGSVRFQPANGGRGTRVRVELNYTPPAGIVGHAVAKLFGEDPQQEITSDLFQFKQLMETGEVPTTKGQPAGSRSILSALREDRIPHP